VPDVTLSQFRALQLESAVRFLKFFVKLCAQLEKGVSLSTSPLALVAPPPPWRIVGKPSFFGTPPRTIASTCDCQTVLVCYVVGFLLEMCGAFGAARRATTRSSYYIAHAISLNSCVPMEESLVKLLRGHQAYGCLTTPPLGYTLTLLTSAPSARDVARGHSLSSRT
jgi:hypothetical protein